MPQSISCLVEAVEAMVKEHMAAFQDPSHDWLHVERVRRMALRIAKAEKEAGHDLDLELVELGALLHDVGDLKYAKEEGEAELLISSLLSAHGWPSEKIARVVEIVEHVSYSKECKRTLPPPTSWEWRCVQDADRLDALGAIGVARCMAFSGIRNRPLIGGSDPITAQAHFYEKLIKLAGLMKTGTGKLEATRRHHTLTTYLQELERETSW